MRERRHFELELRDLQLSGTPDFAGHEVFDPDSRQRVTDSTAVPFRWICHVVTELTNGDTALGTGFLIDPRWVLTAAHCIYPLPKDVERSTAAKPARPIYKVKRIRVYPGRHGAREPFGEVVSNGWIVHPDWAAGREVDGRFDCGAIRLTTAVGDTRFASLGNRPLGYWGAADTNTFRTVLDPATLTDRPAFTAGYPYRRGVNELAARVMTRSEGRIRGTAYIAALTPSRSQGRFNATIDDTAITLAHDVDTEKGQSGGPLWIAGGNGALLLAGVHQGKAAWTDANNRRIDVNNAVRYSRDLAVRIARWVSPATWRATR